MYKSPSVEAQLGTRNSLLYLFNHLVSKLPQRIPHVYHVLLYDFYKQIKITFGPLNLHLSSGANSDKAVSCTSSNQLLMKMPLSG